MSQVYVVTAGSYSDYRVKAVFSTREGAQAWVGKRPDHNVEEYALDLPPPEFKLRVRMGLANGVSYGCDDCTDDGEAGDTWVEVGYDGMTVLKTVVATDDEERAVKVAAERRRMVLTLGDADAWAARAMREQYRAVEVKL